VPKAKAAADIKDEFDEESLRPGTECSFVAIYASLKRNKAKADRLTEVLKLDSGYSTSSIVRVLNRWGHKLSDSTVQRHRRGMCTCVR
jgi:hypothetical protein